MVQLSQTSWQEFSLSNFMETLRYAPMNLKVDGSPILHYTLPSELTAGAIIKYHILVGFKRINWTGIISSAADNQITVRLDKGPFRGFTAKHSFSAQDSMTVCQDEMSFQGFVDISEEEFAGIVNKASIVYGIFARQETRNVMLAVESQKKTQTFEALEESATAG